jgi:hypothetical protein
LSLCTNIPTSDNRHYYPKPRYHRKEYGYTKYHGTTKGYEAKGKGANDAKGKGGKGQGKGKGYSFSRSQYSFPSNKGKGKGKGYSLSRSRYSFPRSKGKGANDTKGKGGKGKGGKGYSVSRSKGNGRTSSDSSSAEDSSDEEHKHDMHAACQNIVFEIAQKWNDNDILEPDGTLVDSIRDASVHTGQRWPFVGPVVRPRHTKQKKNKDGNVVVGSNTEMCTRLNHGELWYCQGTYQLDLQHSDGSCTGQLTFSGAFNDDDLRGKYTIVGGTEAFHGATGHVIDDFDYDTLYSIRQIYIE